MDLDFSSWIALVFLFVFLASLWKITKPQPDSNLNLPPGPRKLPLIGNLHQLLTSSQLPHRTLNDLAAKHGPVMHLQLGDVSTIVISSPEAAKEVMTTHGVTFASRPSTVAAEILFYKNKGIGFSPYSDYWRQLRKICTIELLSTRRVQSFQPLREEEFSNLCKWIACKEGSSINLTENVVLTTCAVMMRASLGDKTDELARFVAIAEEISALIARFDIADLYPSINLFRLFSGTRVRAEKLHKEASRILGDIINNHKEAHAKDKQQQDLVDVLLKFNDAGHEHHLTIENIKAVIQDIVTGGIETTSTTVDWAMAELMRHPRVLKKAQEEVRLVFRKKGFVDEADFDELKYLKLVIKETLRMHPPAPLLLPRQNSEHCEINGFEIPAKTRTLVNAWAMGRDPKQWDEPNDFIPERFLNKSIDYKANDFKYIPFGAGRRICPGMTFGLANTEVPLAMFLYHFDWILPKGIKPENLDMTEAFGTVARRKNQLYVIPVVKFPLLVKET